MKNIVNIINFVRQCEPRSEDDSYLFNTTKEELELCRQYGFPSTLLLQYDALIDERYIQLIKNYTENTEIGLWLEVVKPLTEAVGINWQGRYPWDWHNDVGFLVGYTKEERILLIDESFKKFKEELEDHLLNNNFEYFLDVEDYIRNSMCWIKFNLEKTENIAAITKNILLNTSSGRSLINLLRSKLVSNLY